MLFGYELLSKRAIEEENFKVISLEKLLFLKALGISEPKYKHDLRLIVQKINKIQYGKDGQFEEDYFLINANPH